MYRQSPVAAEAQFRQLLSEVGAVLLEQEWLGVNEPHWVRCAAGHRCRPRLTTMKRGVGICRTCAGQDPAVAEAEFRSRLANLGATSLFTTYLGSKGRHHVKCPAGHDCYPSPNSVQTGQGICRACAGQDPAAAETAFRSHLQTVGATPLFERWQGVNKPHHVRCATGHDAWPYPNNVRAGEGICRVCRGSVWDAFYVVTSASAVKFGITSGDPRPRLSKHFRKGFVTIELLATALPENLAPRAEAGVKSALAQAAEVPVQGKEYFDISCVALVLRTATSYLSAGVQA